MKLADYMSQARFPLTSQSGLSVKEQFMIDAFNLDQLTEYQSQGNHLNEEQKRILAELQEKVPFQKELMSQIKDCL